MWQDPSLASLVRDDTRYAPSTKRRLDGVTQCYSLEQQLHRCSNSQKRTLA